ncbi:hypothetical protein MPH_04677 [Macrophomina phaseolina MS6]|uniref:Uncharacterized protein n=1 Tax=Macrophomina phaseolina (strain MS6) TaxID=1126212 RepID=K2RTB6_MACPH|nr:hypothetical protein MPH_04677 [Macrophomina phaseolina MS6]
MTTVCPANPSPPLCRDSASQSAISLGLISWKQNNTKRHHLRAAVGREGSKEVGDDGSIIRSSCACPKEFSATPSSRLDCILVATCWSGIRPSNLLRPLAGARQPPIPRVRPSEESSSFRSGFDSVRKHVESCTNSLNEVR